MKGVGCCIILIFYCVNLSIGKLTVVFKTYNQHEAVRLRSDLDKLVEANNPVRVINTVNDHLNIDGISS